MRCGLNAFVGLSVKGIQGISPTGPVVSGPAGDMQDIAIISDELGDLEANEMTLEDVVGIEVGMPALGSKTSCSKEAMVISEEPLWLKG